MIHMASPMAKEQSLSPYSILFDEVEKPPKQSEMVKRPVSPEITGHEDALFLD